MWTLFFIWLLFVHEKFIVLFYFRYFEKISPKLTTKKNLSSYIFSHTCYLFDDARDSTKFFFVDQSHLSRFEWQCIFRNSNFFYRFFEMKLYNIVLTKHNNIFLWWIMFLKNFFVVKNVYRHTRRDDKFKTLKKKWTKIIRNMM